MAKYGKHPRLARQTPAPDDLVWHWFVCSGPHGDQFQWAGGDLGLLCRFIEEKADGDPDFKNSARKIAIESLESKDITLCLKGIQVLAAIGNQNDMESLRPLSISAYPEISKHARTALFERGIKIKKGA